MKPPKCPYHIRSNYFMHAEPSPSHPLVANLGLTGILSVSLSMALFHPTNYPDCSADVRGSYILHHILS